MVALSYALDMMRQGCYMASIDLTDAYYSVPIALSNQKYRLFQFEGVRYKYSRACSLVVHNFHSKTKGSWFESGCYLCAEVSPLQ